MLNLNLLMLGYPLALLVILFGQPEVGRGLLLVSILGGLPSLAGRYSRTERWWLATCGLYVLATILAAFGAADLPAAFNDAGRQFFILGLSVLLIRTLARKQARSCLAMAYLAYCVVVCLTILFLWHKYGTGVTLSAEDRAELKTSSMNDAGIPLNPLSFDVLISLMIGGCVLRRHFNLKLAWAALGSLVLLCIVLSGSRTTLMVIPLALLFNWSETRAARFWRHSFRAIATVVIVVGIGVIADKVRLPGVSNTDLSAWTSGRFDIWQAGLNKLHDYPLTGMGAESMQTDLDRYMPIYFNWRLDTIKNLTGGSYHNCYVAILAEKGIITYLPAMLMLGFVWWVSLSVYHHRQQFTGTDRQLAALAPLITLLFFLRGCWEQPGLLGYAHSTVDFIAYAYAAQIMALNIQVETRPQPLENASLQPA